jgi:hypothetical protein
MMTKILVMIAGFVTGGAIVTSTAAALDRTAAPTRSSTPAAASMTMSGTMAAATPSAQMTQSGTMTAAASSAQMTKLTIQHVLKGCHVWSYRGRQSVSLRLELKRGAQLQLLDQDIDPHGLVQLAGPKLGIRTHMMMGEKQLLTFKRRGVYRFKNKVVEMGPEMKVKTIGPDNTLHLTISVR